MCEARVEMGRGTGTTETDNSESSGPRQKKKADHCGHVATSPRHDSTTASEGKMELEWA